MQEEHNPRLTSSEISVIWSSCLNNSFSICVMKYFLANVDDSDIKSTLEYALDISQKNLEMSKEILKKANETIPVGFTEEDVSPNAPRLYSDAFYLYYLKNMSKVGLSVNGVALTTAAQSGVRNFLSQAILTSTELYNKTSDILLAKGLFIRPPYVSTPDTVDFVKKKKYLGGVMNFNNRPLNVVEITHTSANIETNLIGNALLRGFAQVAKSRKVSDYCTRGAEIAKKHVKVFQDILMNDDIPVPSAWDLEVTDATVSPFSDKLIMFHTTLLISSSISNYATASAASLRKDMAVSYVRLTTESAEYAEDGTEIMIKNEWLEQPPQAPDHKDLATD
ncbi:DUF3231 family protein [Gracilibacillus sp. YIM 98692]|uniref:DUF3231 family protein n=1 Tax=Gracilibacillus sp. YIM 98692 TaxID=2663532 RepID=UPI0013D49435|nr:DUF3231 family protein [Gracilibacillus sp. YIM 98692]